MENRTKAAVEMFVIYGLAEVTNDPGLQRARASCLIGVCGNKDRRDRVSQVDKMSVELSASHSGHLHVGDQAGCVG